MAEYVNVGAIWLSEDGNGGSGKLSEAKIFLSANNYKKEGDKAPDFRLRMEKTAADALGLKYEVKKDK